MDNVLDYKCYGMCFRLLRVAAPSAMRRRHPTEVFENATVALAEL